MYYLGARLTTAQFMASQKIAAGKQKIKRIFTEEIGGTEFIAIVLILVVVIALGVVFKDNIIKIANNLWDKVSGQGAGVTGGDLNKDMADPFGG